MAADQKSIVIKPHTTFLRTPVWQPEGKLSFHLHCPQCDNPNVVVNNVTMEMGGHEFRPTGRVVFHCNGHSDEACRHKFLVVIDCHNGGVQCFVEPDRQKKATLK